MSTYCYQLRFNLMLYNHNLRGAAGNDVITVFQQPCIIEGFFRQS